MKVARLSALHTGRRNPYTSLVIISVSQVDLRVILQLEGLSQWKIPVTPSGIESVTWLVAQCLNQLHHHAPLVFNVNEN
jgi:hypothetical protein